MDIETCLNCILQLQPAVRLRWLSFRPSAALPEQHPIEHIVAADKVVEERGGRVQRNDRQQQVGHES